MHTQTARRAEPDKRRAEPQARQARAAPFTKHRNHAERAWQGSAVQTQFYPCCTGKDATSPEAAVQGPPLHDTRALAAAQQRARRGNQCTHAKTLAEVPASPCAVRRRAEPKRAAPSCRHTQARTANFKSRADYQEHDAEREREIHSFGHVIAGTRSLKNWVGKYCRCRIFPAAVNAV